jgi:hypothetical protein
MKANETKVDKFLATNETTFAIPFIKEKTTGLFINANSFFNDIIETGKNDKTNAHFIGSIVYVHDDVYTASGLTELTIIDGHKAYNNHPYLYCTLQTCQAT